MHTHLALGNICFRFRDLQIYYRNFPYFLKRKLQVQVYLWMWTKSTTTGLGAGSSLYAWNKDFCGEILIGSPPYLEVLARQQFPSAPNIFVTRLCEWRLNFPEFTNISALVLPRAQLYWVRLEKGRGTWQNLLFHNCHSSLPGQLQKSARSPQH